MDKYEKNREKKNESFRPAPKNGSDKDGEKMRAKFHTVRVPQTTKGKLFTLIAMILVVAVSMILTHLDREVGLSPSSMRVGECELHMIDVGQGDSFLLTCDAGNILIDAGKGEAEPRLNSYLLSQGITDFEYVIFTHPHEDHIGGGDMILKNFDVKRVIMPDVTTNTACFENLLLAIDNSGADLITASVAESYSVGGLSFKILGPEKFDPDNLNNCSIVLRAEYGNVSMLFSGDAEKPIEYEVLDSFGYELDCDIYKVAHHGSSTSNGERFVLTVSPGLALISCEVGNSYGHPHREVITMLEEMDIPTRRTDADGDVVVATDGKNYWIKEE